MTWWWRASHPFLETVEDDHKSSEWVRPPPARGGVRFEAEQDRGREIASMSVTRPSVLRTGLPSVAPVRALPNASPNIVKAVMDVHAIPRARALATRH
jgi:hypothetical protein